MSTLPNLHPASSAEPAPPRRVGLRAGLWAAQIALAGVFLMAGAFKAFTPIAELAAPMPWVTEVPAALVRFVGVAELAGAIGLILPSLSRVRPLLTPLAALGLATVMLLASVMHLADGEPAMLPVNAALGGLAMFVAWGRWSGAPIRAR